MTTQSSNQTNAFSTNWGNYFLAICHVELELYKKMFLSYLTSNQFFAIHTLRIALRFAPDKLTPTVTACYAQVCQPSYVINKGVFQSQECMCCLAIQLPHKGMDTLNSRCGKVITKMQLVQRTHFLIAYISCDNISRREEYPGNNGSLVEITLMEECFL